MKPLRDWFAGLTRRSRSNDATWYRRWLIVLCAVLCLAVAASVLFTLKSPANPRAGRTADQSTATATAMDTATSTLEPTATHAKPTATPVKVVVHPPPPPALPTPPPTTPTATPCPTATSADTATPTDTATTTTTAFTVERSQQACAASCPVYTGNNPSQSQIQSALITAADMYGLPHDLVFAVAWQESRWHEDVTSCDGGVGLMQIQYYLADYFNNNISYGSCGLSTTSYDISTLQGNANLGAKVLRYLYCYYTYGAGYGGLPTSPADGSSQANYWNAGLAYPDTQVLDGGANPNGVCAGVYNDPNHPEYPALPSTTSQPWSCPYTPSADDNGHLLDIVLSAYNAGQGAIYSCSCIPNPYYVSVVESFVPQFNDGTLPQ